MWLQQCSMAWCFWKSLICVRHSIRHVRQHFHSHLTTHSTGIIKPSGEFIELISGIPCSFTKNWWVMTWQVMIWQEGWQLCWQVCWLFNGILNNGFYPRLFLLCSICNPVIRHIKLLDKASVFRLPFYFWYFDITRYCPKQTGVNQIYRLKY